MYDTEMRGEREGELTRDVLEREKSDTFSQLILHKHAYLHTQHSYYTLKYTHTHMHKHITTHTYVYTHNTHTHICTHIPANRFCRHSLLEWTAPEWQCTRGGLRSKCRRRECPGENRARATSSLATSCTSAALGRLCVQVCVYKCVGVWMCFSVCECAFVYVCMCVCVHIPGVVMYVSVNVWMRLCVRTIVYVVVWANDMFMVLE